MQNQITPGCGLTLYVGSDKYSYTILSYENSILKIQQDIKIGNEILPNSNGNIIFIKRYPKHHNFNNWFSVVLNEQTGRFNKKNRVSIKFGEREYFIDPSF